MTVDRRRPLSPAEFDTAVREITRRNPNCWISSTYRGPVHNIAVGGHADSKHAMLPTMACDFGSGTDHGLQLIAADARELALWFVIHNAGSGSHVHVQGLPPGPVDSTWLTLFGEFQI
jgi:hypothetical protein